MCRIRLGFKKKHFFLRFLSMHAKITWAEMGCFKCLLLFPVSIIQTRRLMFYLYRADRSLSVLSRLCPGLQVSSHMSVCEKQLEAGAPGIPFICPSCSWPASVLLKLSLKPVWESARLLSMVRCA